MYRGAGSRPVSNGNGSPPVDPAHLSRKLSTKGRALAGAVIALLAIVTSAIVREMHPARPGGAPEVARAANPPRPAFTPAEEAYIRALWPIHGDVQRSTVRMALGQIFYRIDDMDRSALKRRADEALATYRRSETLLQALQPPATVQRDHDEYLAAVRLFLQSAVEVLKMFDDGRDQHLMAAHPMSQKASDKIREVGGRFWPGEFPPN